MIAPQFPADEPKRLQDVYNTQLLDTPEEKEFDEIVQLASDLCNTPISLITLLDTERQWFKAKVGLMLPKHRARCRFAAMLFYRMKYLKCPTR
jgi:hypothetical protein